MFTNCPACNRQYRIRASQLSAAQGQVRCGYCGEQFNALERLSDKPVYIAPVVSTETEMDATLEVIEEAFTAEHIEATEGENYEPDPEPEFDIPEILRGEEIKVTSKASVFAWSVGTLLLLLIIVLQVAWFNRDYLLEKYPETKPWAQKICDRLQCELIRNHSISNIKLLNRDVRLHPHYSNTLLVNASMANQAGKIQPYPRIQFSLFDTSGKMIASRIFTPGEYLDNSIDIKKGMPSNQPVHFVLELTGPMDNAVSFEFGFL